MESEAIPAPPGLSGRDRRHLRGLAQRLRPLVWVGAAGATEGVRREVDEALQAHELVKVRLRVPEDKKALAKELADASGAELCGLVGHTVILFRRDPEEPKIELSGS